MSEQSDLVEKLVGELIATGTMWPETQADMQRYVEEAKAGTLWADDLNYLVALHAKVVLNAEPQDSADEAAAPSRSPDARFEEIKRRFAERYHPETGMDMDSSVRARVYGDFWAEFEEVEKGRPG